jgi:Zn-dependent protease with chaperone function
MAWLAVALVVTGAVLTGLGSRLLAGATWPARDPVGAIVLWQAIGVTSGLSLIGAGVVYGVAPLGDALVPALRVLAGNTADLRPAAGLDWWHLGTLLAATLLGGRLLGVLVAAGVRTVRARRRHRGMLDLLTTPWPDRPGARVLDHPLPVAYCLPGLRSRVVVSTGALDRLEPDQLDAVLAHEQAHLDERHDLVVLPFVAWGSALPWSAGVRRSQFAVAGLLEMRADDRAGAAAGAASLAAAVRRVDGATAPTTLTFAAAAAARIARLERPQPPLPTAARAVVRLGALAMVAVPTVILLLGLH